MTDDHLPHLDLELFDRPSADKLASVPTVAHPPREVFIQGITLDGRTFRPSDWAERLAGAGARNQWTPQPSSGRPQGRAVSGRARHKRGEFDNLKGREPAPWVGGRIWPQTVPRQTTVATRQAIGETTLGL